MSACSTNECADECFALQVLGTSMEPEFMDGEIVIVEPEGLVRDGCYVVAQYRNEWIMRQLWTHEQGGWILRAVNPVFGDLRIHHLSEIVGVIIQKSTPGHRSASKRYV